MGDTPTRELIMLRYLPLLFVISAALACGGSAPQTKGDVRTDAEDLLDAPVDRSSSRAASSAADESMLVLPETPEAPGKEIDGKIGDDEWNTKRFRPFDSKSSVQSGAGFWNGPNDASFRVGIEADAGYLYIAVQVKDDVVVANGDETLFTDGVIVHLRDPALDSLAESLPSSMGIRDQILSQTAIAFLPNGAFFRYGDSDAPIAGEMIYSAVDVRKNGYVIEMGLRMEVLHQVSTLPLDEIAFRVEVMDGDEPDRPGTQTVLSVLPDRRDDSPRMALFAAGGLLPHAKVASRPPREKALGRWEHEDDAWTFLSFERVPKLWMTVADRSAFNEALASSDALDDLCRSSVKDIELLEAYTSRGGGFRAGLVLCGARAPNGKCPEGSQSNLFWVGLKKEQDQWTLREWTNVFGEPLKQCTTTSYKGGELYGGFSVFPVDVIDKNVWAVGWTKRRSDQWQVSSANGVTFINIEKDGPIATVTTQRRVSEPDTRVRANSSVYLMKVDKDDTLDICQLETVLEQDCNGIDRSCRTADHGTYVHSIIQFYKPRIDRFERYDLTKHPNCSATTFEPNKVNGYLLLQNQGRVGLVETGKRSGGSDEDGLF